MTSVLFVKANNRPAKQAVSVKLYEAFLASYKESHPNDIVTELDLYEEDLPYVGADMINGTFKVSRGLELTENEAKTVAVADKFLDQFLAADKVVFGFPLWNLTIPAVLHTYLDYLNRSGKTFKYTPEGPVGLLENKKVALLNASGGVYSKGPASEMEMSVKYVAGIMSFFGVKDITRVVIEGHNQFPNQTKEIIAAGLEKAVNVANEF